MKISNTPENEEILKSLDVDYRRGVMAMSGFLIFNGLTCEEDAIILELVGEK